MHVRTENPWCRGILRANRLRPRKPRPIGVQNTIITRNRARRAFRYGDPAETYKVKIEILPVALDVAAINSGRCHMVA